jgi:succinyl-CoA synthetase alpha subunit
MRDCGTNVVGGVTPGKGGQNVMGVPVFDTPQEAVRELGQSIFLCSMARSAATSKTFSAKAASKDSISTQ